MHVLATPFRPRSVRAAVVSLLWVIGPAATVLPQAAAPKFDVTESPISADELAKELGYQFYGNTWKFSTPTFVRVRMWDADGSAADVPARPPKSAEWSDVYAPDKPQTEITVHVLEKTDEKNTKADGTSDYTRIQMAFKINAKGKDAPEDLPSMPGVTSAKLTTSGGAGTSVTLSLMEGPHQGFNTECLHANGDLGKMFQSIGEAIGDAVIHPDRPDQKEKAEATIRDDTEAGLRAAPLNVCYFKGEVCGPEQNSNPDSRKVPKKRAVCLVTLECSREPFKDTTSASAASSNSAKVASDH